MTPFLSFLPPEGKTREGETRESNPPSESERVIHPGNKDMVGKKLTPQTVRAHSRENREKEDKEREIENSTQNEPSTPRITNQ